MSNDSAALLVCCCFSTVHWIVCFQMMPTRSRPTTLMLPPPWQPQHIWALPLVAASTSCCPSGTSQNLQRAWLQLGSCSGSQQVAAERRPHFWHRSSISGAFQESSKPLIHNAVEHRICWLESARCVSCSFWAAGSVVSATHALHAACQCINKKMASGSTHKACNTRVTTCCLHVCYTGL
jgi:hypothetical protein